jgi:hypothetical protein
VVINKLVDAETAPQFERLSRCLTERVMHQTPDAAARLIQVNN